MMPTLVSTLNFARENHISVIPIRSKEKKPALAEWKSYQNRCPTEEEIQKWFFDGSGSNIAFVCGDVSGGDGRALLISDFESMTAVRLVDSNYLPSRELFSTIWVDSWRVVLGLKWGGLKSTGPPKSGLTIYPVYFCTIYQLSTPVNSINYLPNYLLNPQLSTNPPTNYLPLSTQCTFLLSTNYLPRPLRWCNE